MSLYDAARISKPRFFSLSPLKAGRGKRNRVVIGFDSEAERGEPFMLQFNDHGGAADTELLNVPPGLSALHAFTSWVHAHCHDRNVEYLIFGWNLAYEFTQLFSSLPPELYTQDEYHFIHEVRDIADTVIARYNVQVFNSKRYAATFTRLALVCIPDGPYACAPGNHKCGSKRRVRLLDGMAFYVTSLDSASEMLGIGNKVAKPLHFTRKAADSDHFREYARQDAWLTRRIGENIVELHDEFDVTQCISAPHFASKVFKRHFLKDSIPLANIHEEQAGLSSYHGGKNGYYLGGPTHLRGIYSYDIVSAYPEAMRAIPDPTQSVISLENHYQRDVHALWCVTGILHPCRYGGLQDHGGTFHRKTKGRKSVALNKLWITSYELDAVMAHGELKLTDIYGFKVSGPTGSGPLVEYVDKFFDMKRTSTGAMRAAAKLFLNSLYGKFFQKVPLGSVGYQDIDGDTVFVVTNPDQEFDWQAGGLYHPPIASLITGFVRAKIHRLEHKYDAIMTSTDGFFARKAPDPADIGTGLGQLSVERGDLSIWRERLYCFMPASGKPKYALHGFRGTLEALRRIPLLPGAYSYAAQQMVTLRLSLHRLGGNQYRPGAFAELEFTLDLTGTRAPP